MHPQLKPTNPAFSKGREANFLDPSLRMAKREKQKVRRSALDSEPI